MKMAARRRIDRRGNFALDGREIVGALVELGHLRQQRLRIRMIRALEKLQRRRGLDDAPQIHDDHAVGEVLDHAEIVADEQIREVEVGSELHEEIQHLRLNRDIERGDRFVADQQLGLDGQGTRDADARALAAGELVRKAPPERRVEPDFAHQLVDVVIDVVGGIDAMHARRLADDFGHAHARIERREGILKHHLNLEGGVAALGKVVEGVSLDEKEDCGKSVAAASSPRLSIAAVDIADWSIVVDRLSKTIASPNVPTQKTSKYQPPLLNSHDGTNLSVTFSRKDVLGLAESDLKDLILGTTTTPSPSPPPSLLITLMFTLNELFTTHMAKTTGLLLQMTEILPAGAVLLVVDSPGSYSTLKLGKAKDGAAQERQYPMKFLLDHTLLSVAKGKWERVLTQDSRWWRRDAARLRYEVGEGAGLEDMRYQVHVYRRL